MNSVYQVLPLISSAREAGYYIALLPGHVGGEKRPVIDCLCMHDHFQKTWKCVYIAVGTKGALGASTPFIYSM